MLEQAPRRESQDNDRYVTVTKMCMYVGVTSINELGG